MASPVVSIVVPTFNRRASLQRLLSALEHQTYDRSLFEVIVVDDGSTDGTLEFVKSCDLTFTLCLITQEHAGPAAARNKGVDAAHAGLILFLDDDVVPMPSLIEEHVAAHASSPNTVVIGPMSPPGSWPRPVWVRWEEDKLNSQYRAMLAGEWACSARQFYTGNASIERARFLAAGGFDTTFKRAEDVELGYRLDEAGAQWAFNARAEVLHYAWRSFESWCRTPYQYGRNDVIMQRDKARQTLDWATHEFHGRNPLNRLVVRTFAGRRRVLSLVVPILASAVHVAARLGAERAALHALSAIFSLLYWQGVVDEVGDPRRVWRAIARSAPARQKPAKQSLWRRCSAPCGYASRRS